MYPTKLGAFPPTIDLGIQPTFFTRDGADHIEPRHHIAISLRAEELPELLGELRRAVYGDGAATPEERRAFLAAALAALSNALWHLEQP